MTLIKDSKADFIQDNPVQCEDYCDRTLQWGREGGLRSKHRWEFTTKEQGGHQWIENSLEEISDKREDSG